MTDKNKKRILNAVMIIGTVLLIATAWEVYFRSRTQNEYELLAQQRVEMEEKLSPSNSLEKPTNTIEQVVVEKNIATDQQKNSPGIIGEKPIEWAKNKNSVWLDLNPDFLGWVKVPRTEIDYPYVRSQDNQEYLKQDFYQQPSKAGTLFMDYRNLSSFSDDHILIDGHNMKNGTMFHDLVKYHGKEFYRTNQEITVSDLYGSKQYRVFSVYEISADDYQLPVSFKTEREKDDYIKRLQDLSMHRIEERKMSEGQIVSLITCSYGENNGRTIIHALEISEQP